MTKNLFYVIIKTRDLFVHKAGLNNKSGKGTLKLAEEGALVIENAVDILMDWGWNKKVKLMKLNYNIKCNTGNSLAEMLEKELDQNVIQVNGKLMEVNTIN